MPRLPGFFWYYYRAADDWFATTVYADGTVGQMRRHRKDDAPSDQPIGEVRESDASQLITTARQLLRVTGGPAPALKTFPAYSALLKEPDGSEKCASGPAAEITRGSVLGTLQSLVLATRRSAYGRSRWSSMAARLMFGYAALAIFWAFLTIRGDTQAALARSGEKLEARVVDRKGPLYGRAGDIRFVLVQFDSPTKGSQTRRISDFLSAENLSRAIPGTKVTILFDPANDRAFIQSDIERYNRDKKWMFLPGVLFLVVGLLAVWLVRGRRVGRYEDGQEYLIAGDRVTLDDKDLPVPRHYIQLARFLDRS